MSVSGPVLESIWVDLQILDVVSQLRLGHLLEFLVRLQLAWVEYGLTHVFGVVVHRYHLVWGVLLELRLLVIWLLHGLSEYVFEQLINFPFRFMLRNH